MGKFQCKGFEGELLLRWLEWDGGVQCGYTNRLWTADQMRFLSTELSTQLKSCGLRQGHNVAFVLGNSVAFPVALFSLLSLGCNPVLIHCSTPLVEIERLCSDVDLHYIVYEDLDHISRIQRHELSPIMQYSIENIHLSVSKFSTNELFVSASSGVVIHLTSGTSGKPKICIRDQKVAVAEAINYTSTVVEYFKKRVVITTPLSHAFGYGFGLIASIVSHSTLVLDTTFNPKRLLRNLTLYPSDILAIVPPMVRTLIHQKQLNSDYIVPNMVFYAGARCDRHIELEFESIFSTSLFSIYGSTETGAISTNYSYSNIKLPGVGRPLKNVMVRISKAEQYSDIAPGVGEVEVCSSSMMQAALSRLEHVETRTTSDFYGVGDLGVLDNLQQLNIVGRVKDVINLGGLKVDPHEIEHVILQHPGVSDTSVYPGKTGDQAVILCSVVGEKLNIAELRQYCYQNLNPYKVPHAFYILPNKLPRTQSGKCIKVALPGYANDD